jgi:hypothetical protein
VLTRPSDVSNWTTNIDELDRGSVFSTDADIKGWELAASLGLGVTVYKANPKHGKNQVGDISADARAGGSLFQSSIPVNGNSSVAIDAENGVFVVYRWDNNGQVHGYETDWSGLRANQQAVLIKARMVTQSGRPIRVTPGIGSDDE